MIVSISAASGFLIGQDTKSPATAQTAIVHDTKKSDFIKVIQSENILSFQSWEYIDGKKFFAVVRQLNEPCEKELLLKSCQKLSIYDETKKEVYELKDAYLDFVGLNRFKPNSSQLTIERNGGGTDSFLEIIDYKDGKFTELIDWSETQFRGGYWTMPEYRSGMESPYFKPSQLIVIQQMGGSDPNPSAAIFRHKNNKFQQVGEITMQELGDFIEKQLAENLKTTQKSGKEF